jgi:hypothetical protein
MLVTSLEDTEAKAFRELGRRVARVRAATAAVCALSGIACGFIGYFLLRRLQLALVGVQHPALTGVVSVVPCLWASGKAAEVTSRWVLRLRGDSWIATAASRHGVARERLVEFLSVWR